MTVQEPAPRKMAGAMTVNPNPESNIHPLPNHKEKEHREFKKTEGGKGAPGGNRWVESNKFRETDGKND